MNWFERYGIVGTFFIAMIGAWLFFLFPEVCKALLNSNKTNYIVSFAGLSFLPFGYIIMVFSQRYYYLVNQKKRIHCRYWQDLPKNQRERILNFELGDNLEAFDASSEAQVEAILAYYDRMYIQDTDRNKFASTFATKRYDMIAINNGLTWAIFFSFFAATFLSYFISKNFESIAFVLTLVALAQENNKKPLASRRKIILTFITSPLLVN